MPLTCESIHAGFLAQPVNAYSSLAFLAACVFILVRAVRNPAARAELLAFAGIAAAAAVASFIFHGPAPVGLRWLDFAAAVSVPLFVAVHDLGLIRGWPVRRRLFVFACAVAVVGVVLLVHGPVVVFGFIATCAVVGAELAAFRAGYRPAPRGAPRSAVIAWFVALAIVGLAGVSYLLGTTWSPVCNPQGLWQFHAVWHVLGAVALAAYAYAAIERDPPPPRATSELSR